MEEYAKSGSDPTRTGAFLSMATQILSLKAFRGTHGVRALPRQGGQSCAIYDAVYRKLLPLEPSYPRP
jgi:hypothetical protein